MTNILNIEQVSTKLTLKNVSSIFKMSLALFALLFFGGNQNDIKVERTTIVLNKHIYNNE